MVPKSSEKHINSAGISQRALYTERNAIGGQRDAGGVESTRPATPNTPSFSLLIHLSSESQGVKYNNDAV